MNIHPGIPASYHEEILEAAKKANLDVIEDWGSTFYLTKISGSDNRIIPEGRVGRGSLSLIGSEGHVGLYLNSTDEWFRTSAVINCVKTDTGYEITTQNSVYKLEQIRNNAKV